ncbi:SRPBCC family protein [Brevibacterium album]|uniref:SRPBCC family protein n=1 Tax=Brevibacterium album TaxID=417948 RepID=UPI000422A66D|nr:SRPBCC family protein [Brevibacterium album]
MPITAIDKDAEALTLTITADFPVPLQRLWEAYADPRQIERFWGPPEYPATFTRHDMVAGGRSHYFMTGPEGDTPGGYWEFLAVDAPHSFEVRDGFADADGSPSAEMPTMRMVFSFEETPEGSRLTTVTHFNSAEQLDQLLEMGMLEGTKAAMGQIETVLADLSAFAADRAVEAEILSDTQVRVSRVIRGSVEDVWRAHHDPALLQRWQLGPDGWTMPVCEISAEAGSTYRFEWESEDGRQRFGFTGEIQEVQPPHREVTTERMIGGDQVTDAVTDDQWQSVVNEMTLTPVAGGTLLSLVITYPDAETRDAVLATGMTDGMEASYARLEREVFAAA